MSYNEDEVGLKANEIIVLIKYYLERDVHLCCFNQRGAQREQSGPLKQYIKGVDGKLRFEDE